MQRDLLSDMKHLVDVRGESKVRVREDAPFINTSILQRWNVGRVHRREASRTGRWVDSGIPCEIFHADEAQELQDRVESTTSGTLRSAQDVGPGRQAGNDGGYDDSFLTQWRKQANWDTHCDGCIKTHSELRFSATRRSRNDGKGCLTDLDGQKLSR